MLDSKKVKLKLETLEVYENGFLSDTFFRQTFF